MFIILLCFGPFFNVHGTLVCYRLPSSGDGTILCVFLYNIEYTKTYVLKKLFQFCSSHLQRDGSYVNGLTSELCDAAVQTLS